MLRSIAGEYLNGPIITFDWDCDLVDLGRVFEPFDDVRIDVQLLGCMRELSAGSFESGFEYSRVGALLRL
jgi:hypothetical protein